MHYKIVHLIDDEKFTDFVVSNSLLYNSINNVVFTHYFLLNNTKLVYTKSENSNIILIEKTDDYFKYIQQNKFDVILIHCLTLVKSQVISKLNTSGKCLVWLMWGVDFYNSPLYKKELYETKTRDFINKENNFVDKIKKIGRPFYHKIKFGSTFENALKETIKKIDIFVPVIDSEFKIITENSPLNAKLSFYPYVSISSIFSNYVSLNNISLGKNIFIGNSNTFECNHLDIFHLINERKLEFNEIIVPLSYGGSVNYRDEVVKNGKAYFGNKFKELVTFLNISEYNLILFSCNCAIYNHKRQQAVGNIIISLYLGQKVFLSEDNILFGYLKNKGIIVFSIQKELFQNELSIELSNDQKMNNRRILEAEYGDEGVKLKYDSFYSEIVNVLSRKK